MPFKHAGALRYYQFKALSNHPVAHAIFTRRGGVSEGPFAELNVGATVGDQVENVKKNLELAFAAVNRPRNSLFDSWLVHGTHALVAEAPRPPEWERPPQADIVVTNKPHVTLFMRYADCVPIVLYDPVKRAIGLAHAGWRGTLQNVAARAVDIMSEHFGSQPEDLVASLGPAICVDHYEVGPEVAAEVTKTFGANADRVLRRSSPSIKFDLVGANRLALEHVGVLQVEVSDSCTFSNTDDWFSHRASGGTTGRFGALIALNSE